MTKLHSMTDSEFFTEEVVTDDLAGLQHIASAMDGNGEPIAITKDEAYVDDFRTRYMNMTDDEKRVISERFYSVRQASILFDHMISKFMNDGELDINYLLTIEICLSH